MTALIERMRVTLFVWEDNEPFSRWPLEQREHAEAFEVLQLLANALDFYASGVGHREIEDGGAMARTALARLRGEEVK